MAKITFDIYARKYEKEIKQALGYVAHYCKGVNGTTFKDLHFCYNSRLSRAWARCSYGVFVDTIEFSKFIEPFSQKLLIGIFIHEILHSVCGHRCGHKGLWLKMANLISRETDFEIQQYVGEEEKECSKNIKYKYDLYCDTCNKRISGYARYCGFFDRLKSCSCNTCHTHNLRVVQNY